MGLDAIVSKENNLLRVDFVCDIAESRKLGVLFSSIGIDCRYPFIRSDVSNITVEITSKHQEDWSNKVADVTKDVIVAGLTVFVRQDQKSTLLNLRCSDMLCDFLLDKMKKRMIYVDF